ncbi:MAG: universal stress protein [Rhodobacteraceae bacterium]|nr:universal stress protein [Paracoccaceae bacterium]
MFKSILLPVDLGNSQTSERAAQAAVGLAQSDGAALIVLNVVPDFGMALVGSYFDETHQAKMHEQADAQLAEWISQLDSGDLEVQGLVVSGSIYDQIINQANELGCDAIVLGAHRPELKDYLLGPNASRVVRHAAQSVFVIRDT